MKKLNRGLSKLNGSGLTLTYNEIKDLIKVIIFLENGGDLFVRTTKITTSQKEGLLHFIDPLMKVGVLLMRNINPPLAKSVLITLGLIAASSARNAAVQKKIFGSVTALIISNEEMNDIMKIVESLEDSALLIKSIRKTIRNETKEQKDGFLGMLLYTLGTSLLENMLAVKGALRAGEGRIRSSKYFQRCLIL